VENSATFASKTKFSQEKFLKQKQRRHAPLVQLIRPNHATICEAAFLKFSHKTCSMRLDSLSQILHLSGVCSGSRPLIADGTHGLLAGAFAERLGGSGRLLAGHTSQEPTTAVFQWYNLTGEQASTINWFKLDDLTEPATEAPAAEKGAEAGAKAMHQPEDKAQATRESTAEGAAADNATTAGEDTMDEAEKAKQREKQARWEERQRRRTEKAAQVERNQAMLREGSTSLVVASNENDLGKQFFSLFPYLQCGFPFCVYSEYQELLTEVMLQLRAEDCTIRLQLAETWLREYQVLPERTHPVMSTSAASGYVLSGIKVVGGAKKDNQMRKKQKR